ncbi:hypothetical protein [Glycomyces buryatensis]|uniref:Uncharacterized protein n=1 Tax=Glycomyces buryatensis TaxID=2570927 RepID=A0A4S8Q9Q6_9ACTN|nr:hypothetical protein [Glycomyces buryatensis]THV41167.1 hypothetical protein FAB82_13025 [Glycomyces buryatensis]
MVYRTTSPRNDIDSPDFDVAPGQLWIGRQESSSELLIVLDVHRDQRTVAAAPITIEPGIETGDAVVLAPSVSPLETATAVWTGLVRDIPVRVLARPLGTLGESLTGFLRLAAANGATSAPDLGARPGTPDFDLYSPSVTAQAAIEDRFEEWASSLEPLPDSETPVEPVTAKLPVGLADVIAILRVPQATAMAILRRERPLDPQELERLASATGIPESEIQPFVPDLPPSLLTELEQPRWRRLVEAEAAASGTDERAARQTLGREAYALAARQRGDEDSVWRGRVRMLSLARLDEHPTER